MSELNDKVIYKEQCPACDKWFTFGEKQIVRKKKRWYTYCPKCGERVYNWIRYVEVDYVHIALEFFFHKENEPRGGCLWYNCR